MPASIYTDVTLQPLFLLELSDYADSISNVENCTVSKLNIVDYTKIIARHLTYSQNQHIMKCVLIVGIYAIYSSSKWYVFM